MRYSGGVAVRALAVAILGCACGSLLSDEEAGGPPVVGIDGGVDAASVGTDGGVLGVDGEAADAKLIDTTEINLLTHARPTGIAATDEVIVWIERETNHIHSIPAFGSTPMIHDISVNATAVEAVAIHDDTVVWSDGTGLHAKPLAGGNTISFGPKVPRSFAVVSPYLYGVTPSEILRWQFPSLSSSEVSVESTTNAADVTAFEGKVYWVNTQSQMKAKTTGTAPASTYNNEPDCTSIVADVTGVYWTRGLASDVRFLAPGSADPITIAQGQSNAWSIASSGEAIYWLTSTDSLNGTGALHRRLHGSSDSTQLAEGWDVYRLPGYQQLATTPSYVVWTTKESIRRIPR